MKYFIQAIAYALALTAPYGTTFCKKPPEKAEITIPLCITNEKNCPITLHLDLRVDYPYSHKAKHTFLPAAYINERVTIESQGTICVPIPLPQQLHEPYNSFKKGLRAKGFEQTGITIRGAFTEAENPKNFQRIHEDLTGKDSHSLSINNS